MKKILAGAVIAGTALTGVACAQAADLPVKAPYYKAPVVAPIYDWTGFYLGVNAGLGIGRDRVQHGIPGFSSDSMFLAPEGGLGGAQIGYNWQTDSFIGPIVFGIEADIQGADLTDNRTSLFPGVHYNQRLDWFGTVRGRVGLVTGPTLSYVTGGYAYGNIDTTVTEGPAAFSTGGGRSGWTWGTGVEAALGGNWTGKIEYLYLDLGNSTDVFGTQALRTEYQTNIFRAGLNYRFGGNGHYEPVVAANWSGFYLGGNFGSGTGRDRSSLSAGGGTELFNLAPDGFNGGVQAGYNVQTGNWVYGLEADFQGSTQKDNDTCIASCTGLLSAAYNAKLPWFGTVRGRIGYSVGPSLFYVTGGYAFGKVETDITFSSGGATLVADLSDTRSGWTVGGGIETPFTLLGLFGPNWTTKTEYLYVDLGNSTDIVDFGGGITAVANTHVREHIFRTGLNYRFGGPVVTRY